MDEDLYALIARRREKQEDGHDHEWPADLDPDARCDVCGLAYSDWSEVP